MDTQKSEAKKLIYAKLSTVVALISLAISFLQLSLPATGVQENFALAVVFWFLFWASTVSTLWLLRAKWRWLSVVIRLIIPIIITTCMAKLIVPHMVSLSKKRDLKHLSPMQAKQIHDIAFQFTLAMLDSAGCQMLAVGREIGNSVCPSGTPAGVCSRRELLGFLGTRVEDIDEALLKKLLIAYHRTFNTKYANPPKTLDTDSIKKVGWFALHSSERLENIVSPYSNASLGMTMEFFRDVVFVRTPPNEQYTVIDSFIKQMSNPTRLHQHRRSYIDAVEKWQLLVKECEPQGCLIQMRDFELTTKSWTIFQVIMFRKAVDYFANMDNSFKQGNNNDFASLGCLGSIMVRDAGQRWDYRTTETRDQKNAKRETFWLGPPRNIDIAAKQFADYLVPSAH